MLTTWPQENPPQPFAALGTDRVARAGRLQSEHAGCRGRNADRAARPSLACADGDDARAHGCASAAGRVFEVPGIPRRTEQAGFRWSASIRTRGRALTEDRQPRIEESAGRGCWYDRQYGPCRCSRPIVVRGALKKLKILQQKRYAGERPSGSPRSICCCALVMMFYDNALICGSTLPVRIMASSSNSRAVTCLFRTRSAKGPPRHNCRIL